MRTGSAVILAQKGFEKFGASWFFLKVAEEAAEVTHDALKIVAYDTVHNHGKTTEEVIEYSHNLVSELAQLQAYINLLKAFMECNEEFEQKYKEQIKRIQDKFEWNE